MTRGRSTDLCREGVEVTVADELTPEELVGLQIPLPAAKSVTVSASVRYRNQRRCGLEFAGLEVQQRGAIQAACEKLRTRLKATGERRNMGDCCCGNYACETELRLRSDV
jgi:PilZ domain